MPKLKQLLPNTKFGSWTILERASSNKHKQTMYKCLCVCGNTKNVLSSNLRNGRSVSCDKGPCRHNAKPPGVAAWNNILWSYAKNAENRGRKFELSLEQVKYIMLQDCYYCDKAPARRNPYDYLGRTKKLSAYSIEKATLYVNGIDRYDNTKDYIVDNSVACCKECNFLKHDMHGDDFIALCRRVAHKQRAAA